MKKALPGFSVWPSGRQSSLCFWYKRDTPGERGALLIPPHPDKGSWWGKCQPVRNSPTLLQHALLCYQSAVWVVWWVKYSLWPVQDSLVPIKDFFLLDWLRSAVGLCVFLYFTLLFAGRGLSACLISRQGQISTLNLTQKMHSCLQTFSSFVCAGSFCLTEEDVPSS